MPNEFHSQLITLLPRLRVQALALTRNRAAAEDLVQDAVANSSARCASSARRRISRIFPPAPSLSAPRTRIV